MIYCILVGLDDPSIKLLDKSQSWARAAVESQHEVSGWITFETLAICEWLISGRHEPELYGKLVDLKFKALSGAQTPFDKINVSFALPAFIDAGEYEQATKVFGLCKALKMPNRLSQIRNEAQLCLAIAKHRLGLDYLEDEILQVCEKFMLKNMDKWLGDGHSIRAARWMKIIYWNPEPAKRSPFETVLKCYDFLPNCERPE